MEVSGTRFLKTLYILVSVIFYLHILFVVATLGLNYIDPIDKTLTIRGDVALVENDWKPYPVESINQFSEARLLLFNKAGFARIDFHDHQLEAFSVKSVGYVLLHTLWLLLGLFITYQLRNIFRSLTKDKIFKSENLSRIRNIGIALLIIPVVRFASRLVFASYASEHIMIEGHQIGAKGWYYGLPVVLFAILVFVLLEIFKAGLTLQKESELTI